MNTRQRDLSSSQIRLYRINAGSCNGCDVEMATTSCVSRFDVAQLGCRYCESPSDADIVLITGPLTARIKENVLHLYSLVPEHKVTVAVGACPISGGVFHDSYAVQGPLDRYVPVDINVPGCPPRPQEILQGIAAAIDIRRARFEDCQLFSPSSAPQPIIQEELRRAAEGAPSTRFVRGKLHYNQAACVGCRMCEHVCATEAVRFQEDATGLKISLSHNACVFCGLCCHYCRTGALTQTDNWRMTHFHEKKTGFVEHGRIAFVPCSGCDEPMIPVVPELLRVAFRATNPDVARLATLCSDCRLKQSIGGITRKWI